MATVEKQIPDPAECALESLRREVEAAKYKRTQADAKAKKAAHAYDMLEQAYFTVEREVEDARALAARLDTGKES